MRTKTDDFAGDLKSIVEGGKALAAVHASEDPQAKELLDALHVRVKGDRLSLRWRASVSDVWEVIQKHEKWIKEYHAKHCPLYEPKKEGKPQGK